MADAKTPAVPAVPPASATNFGVNCISLLVLFGCYYFLRGWDTTPQNKVLAVLALVALPMGVIDMLVFRVYRRASTGIDWDKPFTPDVWRVATKVLGLAATMGTIAFAYWLFPEYHGSFYDPYYAMLGRFAPSFCLLAPLYIYWLDGYMRRPNDAYWQIGRLLLLHPEDVNGKDVANHARGWLVKAFFLPLMTKYAHNDIATMLNYQWEAIVRDPYNYLYQAGYSIDLVFVTFGYILSLRLFDSHIRTAEPTMLGWVVALFCYEPFFSLMGRQYVQYDTTGGFGNWIPDGPIKTFWQGAIIVLVLIYSLSSVAFGWRFSNLTHRGILTGGPYRFTKHPAYVSKNISWWLISVPFVTHTGVADGIRHSILLFLINTMYFLRARTEERHLSRDPVYVEYALWMNEHGLFAPLGRLIPALRYKPPAGWGPVAAEAEIQAQAAE